MGPVHAYVASVPRDSGFRSSKDTQGARLPTIEGFSSRPTCCKLRHAIWEGARPGHTGGDVCPRGPVTVDSATGRLEGARSVSLKGRLISDGTESRVRANGRRAHLTRECLNDFLVFGKRHLDYLIRECLAHYHHERPYQSLGNRTIRPLPVSAEGEIQCETRLGGLLNHYHRKAA